MTDNGNHLLDCQIDPTPDAPRLEMDIRAIPGVVGTELLLGMAETVLVGDRNGFRRRQGGVLLAELTVKGQDSLHFKMVGGAKNDAGLGFRRES